jgi:hypothetical protein
VVEQGLMLFCMLIVLRAEEEISLKGITAPLIWGSERYNNDPSEMKRKELHVMKLLMLTGMSASKNEPDDLGHRRGN